MVSVKGNNALYEEMPDKSRKPGLWELGLSSEAVTVSPHFVHRDIYTDDYVDRVPVDIMWMLVDCRIRMTLIHYDRQILQYCLSESMAGGGFIEPKPVNASGHATRIDGTLAPAGTLMGGSKQIFQSGNHFVSLNIASQVGGLPSRFRACYLAETPIEIPLGTERSLAVLNWRAVPFPRYSGALTNAGSELISSGIILWDHIPDNNSG